VKPSKGIRHNQLHNDGDSFGDVCEPPKPPSISVSSATQNTVTLNWAAPTTRINGTPLQSSDLVGYVIYYGTSSGNYTNLINVNAPNATSYTVGNLTTGNTYYFTATAIDTNNSQSSKSGEVNQLVN
jgi:hypothetical protein